MKYHHFLKSALTYDSIVTPIDKAMAWLNNHRKQAKVRVEKIKFKDMTHWAIDTKGILRHESGRYFTIEGIDIHTNWGILPNWQQPIIIQPEIGFLGIISKKINGVLHFLMQAKIEPGNLNDVQISPTIQATKSNYTRVHKGRQPLYLNYFLERGKYKILLDQLQSEQGARFLKKRNRNIIIQIEEDIPLSEEFIWLTLGQLKRLIHQDNLVNMDTRTVISGIPYGNELPEFMDDSDSFKPHTLDFFQRGMLISAISIEKSLFTLDDIITWFTHLKIQYELDIKYISLHKINDWHVEDDIIRHKDNKFFRVIATHVEIDKREVQAWTQPLIEPAQSGLCVFIVKIINGIYHFLVQAKVECGNFDILEMAPTVQCLTGNYRDTKTNSLPFLEYVLNVTPTQIKYDANQSEEGGRFYHEQNRNMIVEAEDDFPLEVPANYIWMTLSQMSYFLKFNNYLNIQARSLISAILFL